MVQPPTFLIDLQQKSKCDSYSKSTYSISLISLYNCLAAGKEYSSDKLAYILVPLTILVLVECSIYDEIANTLKEALVS